jgi:DUF1009 family protein
MVSNNDSKRTFSPLGLVVGQGHLPAIIADNARGRGYRVVALALEGLAEKTIEKHADLTGWFNVGKASSIIKFLKKNGVREAVLAGKVPKTVIFGNIKPDLRAVSVLLKLKDKKDDSILDAVAGEFEKEGIRLLDMKEFCDSLLTPEGKLTKKGPSRSEKKDIEFGFDMAKEIGRLDIGQTVIVKDRAVIAVEAIEGTDGAIKRGGKLAKEAVVVKVSRPGQDMRFDVPVVGAGTLKVMVDSGIRVLALEAHKSILMDRDDFLEKANGAGITIMGVKGK